jgi:uncharacterized DUF497 family protein
MEFEWDDDKADINQEKQHLSFREATLIWRGPTITEPDARGYDEDRYITYGLLRNTVLVVIHTDRNDRIRIISARKATPRERKKFYEKIYKSKW